MGWPRERKRENLAFWGRLLQLEIKKKGIFSFVIFENNLFSKFRMFSFIFVLIELATMSG
ncbi:hypothetical protein HanXRQr2_Chr06g0244951 [Helianthus annuus]|uniref:Uncharacterized protein n=1 Tax=Helianthus annuus TaxID=4232 RepID=A0A9K3IQX1_HELAN|nr:hypothetical protein HanXRQr2_Chr06g0244951 [Helianthus annuus]